MPTCRLCNQPTDTPCGPLHGEVCPSCWLAIDGIDEIALYANDIEDAMTWRRYFRDDPEAWKFRVKKGNYPPKFL